MCLGCGNAHRDGKGVGWFCWAEQTIPANKVLYQTLGGQIVSTESLEKMEFEKKALAFEQKVTARSRIVFDGEASLWGTGFVIAICFLKSVLAPFLLVLFVPSAFLPFMGSKIIAACTCT